MRRNRTTLLLLSAAFACLPGLPRAQGDAVPPRIAAHRQHLAMAAASPYAAHRWQFVGPVRMTGRLTDIEAHPAQPKTIYAAAASGGVFKSTDEGESWTPIFEGYATASIGDIAIAPSDPDIVWVGTGEANILRSSMAGTGVYKSTDAGKTFRYMGLPDSHHIGRVLVHPEDPDVVYVAVAGHEYTHNEERGVYKTTDGGVTWQRVFHRDAKTGAIDLAMHPTEPDTLFLGTAERLRYRWNDPKPGPQTGIYKTTDGGRTWRALTRGLPDFAKGWHERVGLDICRSRPDTVYAVINQAGGRSRYHGAHLFRSDDGGETWRDLRARPLRRLYSSFGWFFGQVRVDPNDPETVYVLGVRYRGSQDGGKTWDMPLAQGHADYHAMWINPRDSKHILLGNDGGIMISHDQLRTAHQPRNLPIAQAYNVGCSQEEGGFWLYLSCQDNGAWRGHVDLRAGRDLIPRKRWERAVGDESGRHAVDPKNPDIVYSVSRYGGRLQRTDYAAAVPRQEDGGQGRRRFGRRGTSISPDFGAARKRAQWVSPLIISPVDHRRLLYGAQFVFLSDDRGDSWRRISPDLSNFDPARQGNIAHAVVFSLAESKVEKGVIYAGTDDGNVQVTRDEGETWKKVDRGLPEGRCVASLEACHVEKGRVYVAVNGKRHDDFGTYVYVSEDYGGNWRLLSAAVPGGPANVIKQDPARAEVLYLGTDRGVYVSADGGQRWHVLGKGLPTVYVHDLAIQTVEDYLVAATHGRGHWVLDIRSLRRR